MVLERPVDRDRWERVVAVCSNTISHNAQKCKQRVRGRLDVSGLMVNGRLDSR